MTEPSEQNPFRTPRQDLPPQTKNPGCLASAWISLVSLFCGVVTMLGSCFGGSWLGFSTGLHPTDSVGGLLLIILFVGSPILGLLVTIMTHRRMTSDQTTAAGSEMSDAPLPNQNPDSDRPDTPAKP